MAKKMMLIDTSKCIGCRGCQIACQQWHKLPAEDTSFTGTYQNPPDLSVANLTVVKFTEVGNNGDLRWVFFKDQCRHCDDPPCALACPKNAIAKTKKGFVFIKWGKKGCKPWRCPTAATASAWPKKPCQLQCPFQTASPHSTLGMPRRRLNDGNQLKPKGRMNKCDFCYDRWKNNLKWGPNPLKGVPYNGAFARSDRPACELACPTGAVTTGGRNAKLAEAAAKVDYLYANGYPDANLYPAGWPTHVIWVLQYRVGVYGLAQA